MNNEERFMQSLRTFREADFRKTLREDAQRFADGCGGQVFADRLEAEFSRSYQVMKDEARKIEHRMAKSNGHSLRSLELYAAIFRTPLYATTWFEGLEELRWRLDRFWHLDLMINYTVVQPWKLIKRI